MPVSWLSLSNPVQHYLEAAAAHWGNVVEADRYINLALEQAGDDPDLLVAAYRYFFYTNNTGMAMAIAQRVMDRVRQTEQLPTEWEQLRPILVARREDAAIRLYITAYTASGFLLARMGEVEAAKVVTAQVQEIDTRKEFGAAVVLNVLTNPVDDDEETSGENL